MRARLPLFLATLVAIIPAQINTATGGRPKSTMPACPLKCPAGYTEPLYSWKISPERTVYDDSGKSIVPPDGVWAVNCSLKCVQHAVNKPTKEWTDKKEPLCRSGAEPGPFSGPWRIVGQFARECSSRDAKGCAMHCYEIKKAPAAKKKK